MTDKKWTKKIHPGISTFYANPEDVGEQHLKPLLEHALKYVPNSEYENTPFFLLATAGMRLLANSHKDRLLKEVCAYVGETTRFQLPDCEQHVQVIKGETEGLYGWIAANYLLGGFDNPTGHDHGKDHHTYGFLDMGGASAQIAFAPNATEAAKHAEDLKLLRLRTIGGTAEEYKVFVTTWLGFGANEARRRYVKALEQSVGASSLELPEPCLPSGLKLSLTGEAIVKGSPEDLGKAPHLLGTGKFAECLRQTYPLLAKDKPCLDTPCLINGQHVPAIDFDVNHFVGVSEYWHTTHEVFEMGHKDKAYDFATYQKRVDEFCSQPWSTIQKGLEKHQWGKKVDATKAGEVCFKASWLINMLHDGIGVPRVGLEAWHAQHNTTKHLLESAKSKGMLDPFQAVNKIKDTEVSWTLGKMVLYASSQIPSTDTTALPVGFGTNTLSGKMPEDFQYPGGITPGYSSNLTGSESAYEDSDWHDTLFHDSPRRLPGLLLFLVIVIFAVFLLCGRERRSTFYHKALAKVGLRRRHQRPFGIRLGKAFGSSRSNASYDRLNNLEEGRELNPGDFELPEYDSDHGSPLSSDTEGASSSRAGRASGWATPQLVVEPENAPYSPSKGLASTLSRADLLSRTESRERLVGAARSRATSPRPPGMKDR